PHLIDFFLYSLPPHSELYTLSLHDALPICGQALRVDQSVINAYVQSVSRDGESLGCSGLSVCPLIFGLDMRRWEVLKQRRCADRSEEHTSELQSLAYLVCRLLLEKKKKRPT